MIFRRWKVFFSHKEMVKEHFNGKIDLAERSPEDKDYIRDSNNNQLIANKTEIFFLESQGLFDQDKVDFKKIDCMVTNGTVHTRWQWQIQLQWGHHELGAVPILWWYHRYDTINCIDKVIIRIKSSSSSANEISFILTNLICHRHLVQTIPQCWKMYVEPERSLTIIASNVF